MIKISLFFANFEKKFNLFEIFKNNKLIDAIIQKINILKQIHENIVKMQKYFVNYQKKMTFQLKKYIYIYFNTKNLKNKKNNKKKRKLNHVKIESFFIKKIKKTINYKLNLLKNVKIYSIFYILILKSIDFNIFI